MVKNITGGNKTKKQKRNFGRFDTVNKIEPGQMFAQIVQNNGVNFTVLCSDNIIRLGRLSGSLKKGPRIIAGSYVVVSLRDFEIDQKNCDIIGIGSPPNDIINIFKKNNINKGKKDDIEFHDSDDEFQNFEESSKTKNKNKVQINSDDEDINFEEFNFDEMNNLQNIKNMENIDYIDNIENNIDLFDDLNLNDLNINENLNENLNNKPKFKSDNDIINKEKQKINVINKFKKDKKEDKEDKKDEDNDDDFNWNDL